MSTNTETVMARIRTTDRRRLRCVAADLDISVPEALSVVLDAYARGLDTRGYVQQAPKQADVAETVVVQQEAPRPHVEEERDPLLVEAGITG
jgi:hypothetical protein